MKGFLVVECLSDTCFSTPAFLDGSVDAEVALDPLGLPTVSGKTLHGLLRDTYLSVQKRLDPDGLHGAALLGTPRSVDAEDEGATRIGDAFTADAATGADLRTYIRYLLYEKRRRRSPLPPRALRDAFLLVRTLTAEERATGAPKTESLRFVRVLPWGTVLRAPLTTTRPLCSDELALLERLVRLTRHVGLSRNRGSGEVRLRVEWQAEARHMMQPIELFATCSGATRFLHYRLTLTAPCLITDRELDANSRGTRSYLPGATLRGALAAGLRNHGAPKAVLAEIIAGGDVRFLNAYPEAEGLRALPVPITYRRIKDARYADTEAEALTFDAALDLCTPDPSDSSAGSLLTEQLQPLATPFATPGGVAPDVRRRLTTHQRRNRRTGATQKGRIDTVFVYEALEAEQTFRGCIALPNSVDGDRHRDLLTDVLRQVPLWLGRSARSGYGGVPDVDVLFHSAADAETDELPSSLPEGELFLVRLTSDAVLRDPLTGQHDPYRLEADLRDRFKACAEVVGVCLQATTARGFNRLWRTELPAVPAAAAGSTALLRAVRALPVSLMRDLQAVPLGERTADGYGCFLIEEPASWVSLREPEPGDIPVPEAADQPQSLVTAQKRLYRKRLRALVGDEAMRVAEAAVLASLPSVHLLQRLRGPLHGDAKDALWKARYHDWFLSPVNDERRLRLRALRALEGAWLGDRTLRDLLAEASQPDWLPPAGAWETDDRTRNLLLLVQSDADALWDDVKREPVLGIYFLETLLAALVRRKAADKTLTEEA